MADGVVDLRSDTLTRPTEGMRRAMADAEVGDDTYGEDPTVRALEERYAGLVGKDAAVLVPSGTMANQLALRVLGRPGSTAVVGLTSHISSFEGAASGQAQVQLVTLDDRSGAIPVAEVAWLLEAALHHWVRPSVVCIENTHMFAGGVPWEVADIAAVAAVGLPVHMDGARLLNAAVATGTPAAVFAGYADTVWIDLSKGLGAPVGAVLAGTGEFIERARLLKHLFGGAMRQAGVIAAAGVYALEHHVDRLANDHARARRLATACGIDPDTVETNIVVVPCVDAPAVVAAAREGGVLVGGVGPRTLRLVTHLDVDEKATATAAAVLSSLLLR